MTPALKKVTEGVSGRGGGRGFRTRRQLCSYTSSSTNKTQPRRARRWGTCMDLPQLGPVAVLLLKSRRVWKPPPPPLPCVVSCDTVVNAWIVRQCQYSSVFDGALKVCCPLTSLHVRQSPKPFLAILEYCKESKSEAGEGLGTRLCILFASYPVCCQDYATCQFLRLLQSFKFLVTSSCSWSIWTLYRLRQPTRFRLGPTKTQCWLKCKL